MKRPAASSGSNGSSDRDKIKAWASQILRDDEGHEGHEGDEGEEEEPQEEDEEIDDDEELPG